MPYIYKRLAIISALRHMGGSVVKYIWEIFGRPYHQEIYHQGKLLITKRKRDGGVYFEARLNRAEIGIPARKTGIRGIKYMYDWDSREIYEHALKIVIQGHIRGDSPTVATNLDYIPKGPITYHTGHLLVDIGEFIKIRGNSVAIVDCSSSPTLMVLRNVAYHFQDSYYLSYLQAGFKHQVYPPAGMEVGEDFPKWKWWDALGS